MLCKCNQIVACRLTNYDTIKEEATYLNCICKNCGRTQEVLYKLAKDDRIWVAIDRKLYNQLNTKFNDKTIRQKLAQLYREAFGKQ